MKKILQKLGRMGIVWQITLAFSLIMLVPAAIVAGTYHTAFKNTLMQEAENGMEEKLDEIARNIQQHLQDSETMLDQLEYTQEFNYFLDDENVLSAAEILRYMSSAQSELTNISHAYPNLFQHISIFSAHPGTSAHWGWSYSIRELVYREYFSEIFDNPARQSFGNVRYQQYDGSNPRLNNSADRNVLILPIYRKVHGINSGKCIGVLEADIPLSRLVEGATPTPEGAVHKTFIFNHNNQLIYASDPGLFDSFTIIDIEGEAGITTMQANNKEYLFAYRRCAQTRLLQTVAVDKAALLQSANNMQWILIISALGSVLLLAFFANLVARAMLKSLRQMDGMIEKIEQGDFNVSIPQTGFNEVSRIAGSFNRMASRLQSVIQHLLEKENAQKEAELRALQAQINPHFLYNTLENMRMQCEVDQNYLVGDSLASLGEMMRYSMEWQCHLVPLQTEIKHLKNYLSLLQLRFGSQFECSIHIGSGMEEIMVPKMILQPVVENCFIHGFKNKPAPWHLNITAAQVGGTLMLVITDNGIGIPKDRLEEIQQRICGRSQTDVRQPDWPTAQPADKEAIGLCNVRRRIVLSCLIGSEMTISSVLGQGTSVVIEIQLPGTAGGNSI